MTTPEDTPMTSMFGSIVHVWAAEGAKGLVKAVRSRAWQCLRFVQFRIDLDAWEPGPPPIPSLDIRTGLPELIRFRAHAGSALPVQFFQDEMHGASRPYLGLWQGEVGHISWLFSAGGRGRRLHLVRLGPGDVELDGAFTFRAFRGKGLLSAVEREMLRDAKREGARVAYTHVEADNIASIKGVLKTGFAPYGIVTFSRALGFNWPRWQPSGPLDVDRSTYAASPS
jgi:GNAT superfamily N-acetyltransferase